jgi:hypothetical protein
MTTIASDQRMRAVDVCVGVEVTYPTATLRMEYCGHSARRLHTPSTTGLTKPFGQKAPSGFPNINTHRLRARGPNAAPLSCPSKPQTFHKHCTEKKEKRAQNEPEEEEEGLSMSRKRRVKTVHGKKKRKKRKESSA